MSEIKIVFEDQEWIEVEITQPNNLIGDTSIWEPEDWEIWNQKMKRLENEGVLGNEETFRVKFQKKSFLDGADFTRKVSD